MYACHTQSDLEKLVLSQGTPEIFFKVFLELGFKSMLPYLAFDARSMKALLSSNNKKFFNDQFPLFYKNQDGFSAIDASLDRNQIKSVNLMIDYIITY